MSNALNFSVTKHYKFQEIMYSKKILKKNNSIFNKRTVIDLSENQMSQVDGGTSWMFVGTTSLIIRPN
jgi:hypothetical protein